MIWIERRQNPEYRRHWISRHARIVAPIQNPQKIMFQVIDFQRPVFLKLCSLNVAIISDEYLAVISDKYVVAISKKYVAVLSDKNVAFKSDKYVAVVSNGWRTKIKKINLRSNLWPFLSKDLTFWDWCIFITFP